MAGSISPPPRLQLSETEKKMFVRETDSLFSGVVYWINPAIEQSMRLQISQHLDRGGARPATIRRHEHERRTPTGQTQDTKLNGVLVRPLPQMVHHIARFYIAPQSRAAGRQEQDGVLGATHVISPDTHFGEYSACVRAGVRVVTAQWVERSAAFGWRYVERYFSASAHRIFSGMVILATQMPLEDKERLLASVMALGGQWRERMRADVTHVVMIQPVGKIYDFIQSNPRLGIRAIMPHWFKESINLLKCVPQEPYLFPDPPVLQGMMVRLSAPTLLPAASESPNSSAYDLPKPRTPFLSGYSVAVGSQIREALSEGAVTQLEQRLAEAGARVCLAVDNWDAIDILLCQNRFGYEYSKASRLGKMVCTLVWLYHAMLSGALTSPTLRLLHYPMPLSAVPGMENVVVSVSGYAGAARQYISTLVLAMGARYTPHLSHENTHLVTLQVSGRKYEMAIRANVHVVNHLWVEQCYQRWRLLAVAHPNFTYFPTMPLLSSIVGETEINVGRLSSWVDVPLSNTIAEWSDMDLLSDSDLADDKHDAGAAERIDISSMGSEVVDEDETDIKSVSESGEESTEAPAAGTSANATEPAENVDQHQDAPGLNLTRHTTRAAAMAASKSLSDMMQAANIFEVEMRKERHYKRRNAPAHRASMAEKATANGDTMGAEDVQQQNQQQQNQQQKRRRVESHVRIMLTHTNLSQREEQQIVAMGGEIVATATEATHLVCGYSFKRTLKMLLAITSGRIFIVNRDWLTDSLEQNRWITVDYATSSAGAKSYQIKDQDAEDRLGFSIEQSKRLAQSRRLFEGVTVLFTPNISPGFETMRALVEAAGGRAVTELPEKRLDTLLRANDSAMRNASVKKLDDVAVPLLVVSSELDSQMWTRFHSAHLGYPVVFRTDIILNSLLQQRIYIFNEQDRLLR
ncbi:regulator of Ty1 Transposition [Coemansia sp. RSA 485]|nr:regulator of Ty1 Transposition [Coemansia sp. RSA 485]